MFVGEGVLLHCGTVSRVSGRPFVDCDSIEHRTIDTVSGSVVVAWNLLGLVFE